MKDRIRAIRKALHLTQAEFAEALGTTRTAYAKYENGLVEPSDTIIRLICSTYNIRESWLRTGEGEMHQKSKQDRLEEVIQEFNLSDPQAKALRILMSLPEEQRDAIANAFFTFCKASNQYNGLAEISTGEKLSDEDLIKREEQGRKSEEKASSQ